MNTKKSAPSPVRKAKKLLGRLDRLATEKLKELGKQVKQSFDALMPAATDKALAPSTAKSPTRRRKASTAKKTAPTPKLSVKPNSGSKGMRAKRAAKKRAPRAKSKRSAK